MRRAMVFAFAISLAAQELLSLQNGIHLEGSDQ